MAVSAESYDPHPPLPVFKTDLGGRVARPIPKVTSRTGVCTPSGGGCAGTPVVSASDVPRPSVKRGA